MTAKKSERFEKLPLQRALLWEGLSFFQRAIGSEMFREFQERAHTVGPDWRRAVCVRLAVSGAERANVYRALDGMAEAGCIAVVGGVMQLLYSQSAFDSHHGPTPLPAKAHPRSTPPPPQVHSRSTPGPLHFHPTSAPGPH